MGRNKRNKKRKNKKDEAEGDDSAEETSDGEAAPDADEETSKEGESPKGEGSDGDEAEVPWWRAKTWEAAAFWLTVLAPLAFYAWCISPEITFGDAPEILTAVYRRGITHPSGYPLYSVLGQLFVHLPWATPHWNLAFFLSAVPGAISCGLIFMTLRRLSVHPAVASVAALSFGFNDSVAFQSVKVEVYSLHCMLLAAVIYFTVRYAFDRDRIKWAYLAVMAQCLALTDHLTSVFMVVPLVIALVAINARAFFKPKHLLTMTGIAAACAAIYLYLPLAAINNEADVVNWNDPQTWDRFWYHVRGAEYSKFRDFDKLWDNLQKFGTRPGKVFVPGIMVVVVIGVVEGFIREWRSAVMMLLFMLSSLFYVSTYNINDISTYYGGLYLAGLIFAGLGAQWILKARIPEGWKHRDKAWIAAIALLFLLPATLAWRSRYEHVRDVLAQDMSEAIVQDMPDKAIIFTAVDGHSFPLWYQAYMVHPDRYWVVIDRVLFRLPDKKWYRDFLRRRHPETEFPTEAQMNNLRKRSGQWEKWILDHNTDDHTAWAMLARTWRVPGYYPVNVGWHFRLYPNTIGDPKKDRTRDAMHIYMARHAPVGSRNYFHDSSTSYKAGEHRLACVAEWHKHSNLTGRWTMHGPGGKKVTFKPHYVPSNATISWEFLETKDQVPGRWRCEVTVAGRVEVSREFTLE